MVNPYQYTGQQFDQATGLYDLRARYYDLNVGRFTSRDEFENNKTDPYQIDRYGYSGTNPINKYDPSGFILLEFLSTVIKIARTNGPLSAVGYVAITIYSEIYNLIVTMPILLCILVSVGIGLDLFSLGCGQEPLPTRAITSDTSPAELDHDWPWYTETLKSAVVGRGNYSLGSGSVEDAEILGEAWVGPNSRQSSDGTATISADGLRQWRPPINKQIGWTQSNFEIRVDPKGGWQGNGHFLIRMPGAHE